MFQAIETDRLTIRRPVMDDLDALVERRNESNVARFQSWTVPYSRDDAGGLLSAVVAMDGPENDGWWMATVVAKPDGAGGPESIIGDVAVYLSNERRTAEIGVTVASRFWSQGYAVEAVGAMIDHLLAVEPITRVTAGLHPDNIASALLVERLGFVYEGHTRLSYWEGEGDAAVNSDDLIYGLTRDDRRDWLARPSKPPSSLELAAITDQNLTAAMALATHRSQQRFVASVVESLADALVPEVVDGAPLEPWYRLVMADGVPVGFVMLAVATDHHPAPYLWRLLIDRFHQRRGVGHRVLDLIEASCLGAGADRLLVSWVEGRGSPAPFYIARGFEPTGRIIDGEIEACKMLE